MKKAGSLKIKGTGMDGTIFPPKEKAGDPSAWCWESPAKGGGTDWNEQVYGSALFWASKKPGTEMQSHSETRLKYQMKIFWKRKIFLTIFQTIEPSGKGHRLKPEIHPYRYGSNPVCILESNGCIYGMKEVRVHILPGTFQQLSVENPIKQK